MLLLCKWTLLCISLSLFVSAPPSLSVCLSLSLSIYIYIYRRVYVLYIYIYIYIYKTHTHTHLYIYIYIYRQQDGYIFASNFLFCFFFLNLLSSSFILSFRIILLFLFKYSSLIYNNLVLDSLFYLFIAFFLSTPNFSSFFL